ncbi:hypothetical protein N825_22720 [Skermanella stibiiresistens SB22]|uniref:Uncharacterized protein n=1 Tax=Skermanella stibiiresistens SB22 TaxID=1385369 RepID=W9GZL5_9PROT|nr:hypothetical protein N825_22720 [Skermanella stibiiresistens SB22]
MTGQPDGYGDKTVVTVPPGDMAQAIGGVGQAMEKNDCASDRAVGFELVRSIPILRKSPWIDRAAVEIPIDWYPVFRGQFLRDFSPHRLEESPFRVKVLVPTAVIDFVDAQFSGNVFVPRLKRLTTLGIVYPDDKQCYGDHG